MPDQAAIRGLALHCGGYAVPREQVLATVTPQETDTHYPISHDYFLSTVQNALQDQGYQVADQAHALWGNGSRYFGILTLRSPDMPLATEPGQWDYVLGLRNAHDKSFSASGCVGTFMGTLCDNLMWWGFNVFRFQRKHTRFIRRDFLGVVNNELGKLAQVIVDIDQRNTAYKKYSFLNGASVFGKAEAFLRSIESDDFNANEQYISLWNRVVDPSVRSMVVNDFLLRGLRTKALTPRMLPHVINEWERDDGCGGHSHHPEFCEPTAYKMLNCFTEVEKRYPSLLEGPRRNNRLTALLDAQVGVRSAFAHDTAEVTEYDDDD